MYIQLHSQVCNLGIEIKDFQTPDKMSDTIKYLPDILKIHHVRVQVFKLPQLVYLLKCMIATFDLHKYSFCKIIIYCINKPSIIFSYFFFIHCKKLN